MADKPNVRYTPIVLEDGTDNNGFPGKITSSDNGATRVLEYTADGKVYHQRDIDRISGIPFDKLKFKSPSGAAFYLSVSDDGKPIFTPVEKAGDSK